MGLGALGFALGLLWLNTQAQLLTQQQTVLACAALLCLMLLGVGLRKRARKFGAAILFLMAVAGGCLWGNWQASLRLADALPTALEGQDIVVSGTIAAMPQQIERGWRFEFSVDEPANIPRHISLAW